MFIKHLQIASVFGFVALGPVAARYMLFISCNKEQHQSDVRRR